MRHWTGFRNLGALFLVLCLPRTAAAEDIEPLPVDFLEYLASFESDDDDWTFFADEDGKGKETKQPVQRPQTPPPSTKTGEDDQP